MATLERERLRKAAWMVIAIGAGFVGFMRHPDDVFYLAFLLVLTFVALLAAEFAKVSPPPG